TPACTRMQLGELRILGLGIPDFYTGQLLNLRRLSRLSWPVAVRSGFEEGPYGLIFCFLG
ncbi:MAG: hypothetical protein KAU38_06835, partial [Desulfobacterales bacterium]|nr:hypothetical protein [Desulfobacterales bacterium]